MVKALIVMRSVALFFSCCSFVLSQTDPDPQRYFYSKTGQELFIQQFINWDNKILLQKMGCYSSEVQVSGSGQQINILVVI